MKRLSWQRIRDEMSPHLRARHDFDEAQPEIIEAYKAAVLTQVREGCAPIDAFVLWHRRAGDIDMLVIEAVAIAPEGTTLGEVAHRMRPRLHFAVQKICIAQKARAISSVGIAPNPSHQGLIVTHEAVRYKARAWMAPGLLDVEREVFIHGVGDFGPMSQDSVPPEIRFMWNLLPIECYGNKNTVRTRGGQA